MEYRDFLFAQEGSEYIRKGLSDNDPTFVINNFQEEYGLKFKAFDINAVYPLLEQSGMSRYQVHRGILEGLQKKLIEKIESETWSKQKQTNFLDSLLKQKKTESLRDVIIALLQRYPDLKNEHLYEELSGDKGFISASPMDIKRQFFVRDRIMFENIFLGLLHAYDTDPCLRTWAREIRGVNMNEYLDARIQQTQIQETVSMVGDSKQLFEYTLQILRDYYTRYGWSSICSFRFDFLMAMQGAGKINICKGDPSYELIWFVNQGIRRNMSPDTILNINNYLHKYKGKPEFGAMAMVFQVPIVYNLLAYRILASLKNTVNLSKNPPEPKSDRNISWCSTLINLGSHSQDMHISYNFSVYRVDDVVYEDFYFRLLCIMLDDKSRNAALQQRKQQRQQLQRRDSSNLDFLDTQEDKPAIPLNEGKMSHFTVKEIETLKTSDLARKVFAHYLIECSYRNDLVGLKRALPYFEKSIPPANNTDIQFEEVYESLWQSLITSFIKNHRLRVLCNPQWAKLIEDHVITCCTWKQLIHEMTVKFLIELYSEDVVAKLEEKGNAEKIKLVREWGEKALAIGAKDTANIESLQYLYWDLKLKSAKPFSGIFKIKMEECPNITKFVDNAASIFN